MSRWVFPPFTGFGIFVFALIAGATCFAASPALAAQNPPNPFDSFLTGNSASSSPSSNSTTSGSSTASSTASPFSVVQHQLPDLMKRENFSAAMQIVVLLTVLSLAPSILLMMTSFTRIIIVLSLLRQAIGTPQLPPNQILVGLAMFMTFIVMAPTMQKVNQEAIAPYLDSKTPITQVQAIENAQAPIREFMIGQIVKSHDQADVFLFAKFLHGPQPKQFRDVGTMTLIPAFMLSELKTAFVMGFKVYLPFLVIDVVISTVLVSMGMTLLPPSLIALPFKLLLFVLVDGWNLIVAGLMLSFVR